VPRWERERPPAAAAARSGSGGVSNRGSARPLQASPLPADPDGNDGTVSTKWDASAAAARAPHGVLLPPERQWQWQRRWRLLLVGAPQWRPPNLLLRGAGGGD